ncbi:MAG: hypothetical protein DRN29_04215 [Thermoplasmata archaeon]|nr:MAG: hypothetical protein DRN29_04215 [Thermoplasmata archaeon]
MKKAGLALLLSILIISSFVEAAYGPGGKWKERIEERLNLPILNTLFFIFVIINIFLLLALLILYLNSFVKTKSSFTLGLVFFIGVLLIQKILFFIGLFLHSFLFFPPFFETLALVILLVLSLE